MAICVFIGRHEEALHHVRSSLQYDKYNPISLRLLASLLVKYGRTGEAHKAFTRWVIPNLAQLSR